jgi:hypothetical protein
MFELDIGKLSSDVAMAFMLRGAEAPSIQWQTHPNRGAKRLLDGITDQKLFAPTGVLDEGAGASVRAMLYLWNGWLAESRMYAQGSPEMEQNYINAFCERMEGNAALAKEILQKLGDNPIFEPLTKGALEMMGTSGAPEIQRFRKIVELGHIWEPFAFCDLFTQALSGQICTAGEQMVAGLQAREFELLFCRCYEAATGVNPARRASQMATANPQRKQERKRRAAPTGRSRTPGSNGKKPDKHGDETKDGAPGQAQKPAEPAIKVICPACGTRVTFPASARGQQYKCSKCSGLFLIPKKEGADAPTKTGASPPAGGVRVVCPQCKRVSSFPQTARGQRQTCSVCQAVFMIPSKQPVGVGTS